MAFPADLTAVLTGASTSQLSNWRSQRNPLLVPEVATRPNVLYSFRDVLALRTVVFLRSQVPLQRIRKAFNSLNALDLTEHPSSYRLATDGETVLLLNDDGATDLVKVPGQHVIAEFADILEPFTNWQGDTVVNFLRPRANLEVRPDRLGGWPTVAGTRVPYDTIADLVSTGEISPEEVPYYYPTVDAHAVPDAVSFADQVSAAS